MAEIIAIANQKGGVAKTTTALAFYDMLKQSGKKTLYIDVDPQCNSTYSFQAQVDGVGTLYDLLIHGDTDCIQTTERGDIIAGDPQLKEAGKMIDGPSANFRLKKGLESIVSEYEYVILDTPPALSVLLTNALTAANKVIIPLLAGVYEVQGLTQLGDTIREVVEFTNPTLTVDGILLTRYDERTNLSKEIAEYLPQYARLLNTRIYETPIRDTTKVGEAHGARQSLFKWSPYCTAARDYKKVLKEVLSNG